MRNSKSLVAATVLAALLAAAPMSAAPRFMRDTDPITDPITRLVKFVKQIFGVSTNSQISDPKP